MAQAQADKRQPLPQARLELVAIAGTTGGILAIIVQRIPVFFCRTALEPPLAPAHDIDSLFELFLVHEHIDQGHDMFQPHCIALFVIVGLGERFDMKIKRIAVCHAPECELASLEDQGVEVFENAEIVR